MSNKEKNPLEDLDAMFGTKLSEYAKTYPQGFTAPKSITVRAETGDLVTLVNKKRKNKK